LFKLFLYIFGPHLILSRTLVTQKMRTHTCFQFSPVWQLEPAAADLATLLFVALKGFATLMAQ